MTRADDKNKQGEFKNSNLILKDHADTSSWWRKRWILFWNCRLINSSGSQFEKSQEYFTSKIFHKNVEFFYEFKIWAKATKWYSPRQNECQNYHNAKLKFESEHVYIGIRWENFILFSYKNFPTRMNANELQPSVAHATFFSNIQKYRDNSHSAINHLKNIQMAMLF